MLSVSGGLRCIGLAALTLLTGCASRPEVQSLATGRSDVMGYTLNGNDLETLRQETRRLCPKGAEVLRQSSQGTQLPAPADSRWRRAFQTTAQFLDPPQSAAQMVILCREHGDRPQQAKSMAKPASERVAESNPVQQALAQAPVPADGPKVAPAAIDKSAADKLVSAVPAKREHAPEPKADPAQASKAGPAAVAKLDPAKPPKPPMAEQAQAPKAEPAPAPAAKSVQAAKPKLAPMLAETAEASKPPKTDQPQMPKAELAAAPKLAQSAAERVEQAAPPKAAPASATKPAKRPELSVALPVGPVVPEW